VNQFCVEDEVQKCSGLKTHKQREMLRAMNVSARAYLLKTMLDKELLDTIRAVHAGEKTLSAEADYELAEQDADERLTPLEIDVLQVIATGHANKQIAAQLSITEETVKGRVKNILSKLAQMIVPSQR
jgi:DNA-binding NarL/FixJ family response regulator